MATGSKASIESSLDAADSEALLGEGDSSAVNRRRKSVTGGWRTATLAFIAAFVGIGVGLLSGYGLFSSTDSSCVRRTTQSTPILKDIPIKYSTIPFNGTFMTEDVYRRAGSLEVDAAWEALGVNYRSVRIPVEDREIAGISPDHVQINQKYGGGFPANVEGLHHLHCLNLVRQSLYYNYDYYKALGKGAFINQERILRLHVCKSSRLSTLLCPALTLRPSTLPRHRPSTTHVHCRRRSLWPDMVSPAG